MSVKLTDKQILLISSLSYMDIEKFYDSEVGRKAYDGQTLKDFTVAVKQHINLKNEKIEFNGGYTHEEFLDILEQITKDPTLRDLRIVDYLNDNKQNKEELPSKIDILLAGSVNSYHPLLWQKHFPSLLSFRLIF